MNTFKKCLPDVVAILLFALIGFAYFFVPVTQNKVLFRHDSQASKGLGAEQISYYERTGERTRWVNNLFSGMPTYQISPYYNSTSTLSQALNAYHLWLPENVWYIFAYLLGFYIMLRAFDFRQSLAALGSIIWAFSSYFLIIIAAGHIWKVMALAYLPPMIGGIVMAYRGKYLWGLIVTSIFAAFEVNANHAQMTYYFLFPILFIIIAPPSSRPSVSGRWRAGSRLRPSAPWPPSWASAPTSPTSTTRGSIRRRVCVARASW